MSERTEADAAGWNWGAFLLPMLWPFWNGAADLAAMVWFCMIFSIFAPIGIGIAVYLGLMGTTMARTRRAFRDEAQFAAVQTAWANAGVIVWACLIAALSTGLYRYLIHGS